MKSLSFLRILCIFFLLVLGVIYANCTNAQGNLIVLPRRVVFEGPTRTAELNLANTGKDTAKYVISVVQYRMKEDGNFELITKPDSGQYFADRNFRFFPRSVVLAPNEAQVVRLQLINTDQLKPGEYRSHLYLRAVPDEHPVVQKDSLEKPVGISIKLVAVFGFAIPVIVRYGISTTKVSLSDLSLKTGEDKTPILSMMINRTGNMSVYGSIKITYISPKGVATQVGLVNGLSVYTPNQRRRFQINLEAKPNINYHTGKLQIVYAAEADAKPAKFAEGELLLN